MAPSNNKLSLLLRSFITFLSLGFIFGCIETPAGMLSDADKDEGLHDVGMDVSMDVTTHLDQKSDQDADSNAMIYGVRFHPQIVKIRPQAFDPTQAITPTLIFVDDDGKKITDAKDCTFSYTPASSKHPVFKLSSDSTALSILALETQSMSAQEHQVGFGKIKASCPIPEDKKAQASVDMLEQETIISVDYKPMVTAGGDHTCASNASGALFCWGRNHRGQLGQTPGPHTHVPKRVQGVLSDTTFLSISAGKAHTCAVTNTHQLFCWGDNSFGQLGNANNAFEHNPKAVMNALHWSHVSAGAKHTCALTKDGRAFCWGDNTSRQLGRGEGINLKDIEPIPGEVSLPSKDIRFVELSASQTHTCALTDAGLVYCWGKKHHIDTLPPGVLQQEPLISAVPQRQEIKDAANQQISFVHLNTGARHTCAIPFDPQQTNALIWCWGADDRMQFKSRSSTETYHSIPLEMKNPTPSKIAVGNGFTCVGDSFSLGCFGDNTFGQLTSSNKELSLFGEELSISIQEDTYQSLDAGDGHICFWSTAKDVHCWGDNSFGQTGRPSSTLKHTLAMPQNEQMRTVQVGHGFVCTTHGSKLWCQGDSRTGAFLMDRTNQHATTALTSINQSEFEALNIDPEHICAGASFIFMKSIFMKSSTFLYSAGRVPGFLPPRGKIEQGRGFSNMMKNDISCGAQHLCIIDYPYTHCLGLKDNYRLGSVGMGVMGNAESVSSFIRDPKAIYSGSYNSCLLSEQGFLSCWGAGAPFGFDVPFPPIFLASPDDNPYVEEAGIGDTFACIVIDNKENPNHKKYTISCRGQNDQGQFPDKTARKFSTWINIHEEPFALNHGKAPQLKLGRAHGCMLYNKKLSCWGDNSRGAVRPDRDLVFGPSKMYTHNFGPDTYVINFDTKRDTTCAVIALNSSDTTGKVHCWGENAYGQTNLNTAYFHANPNAFPIDLSLITQ